MNHRIRALAEQQGMTGPNFLISSHELEKFAQLIVKECAEVAADVVVEREGVDFGLVEACYKHFGVEQNE